MSERTKSMTGPYDYIGLQNSSLLVDDSANETVPEFGARNGSHVYMKSELALSKNNNPECIAIITECFHLKKRIWMGRVRFIHSN